MKTTLINQAEAINHKWHLIDAKGKILGRLAVQIANLLRGRTKVAYTPHTDTGDFVVVVNAECIRVTGRKETDKTYASYSGYQSGLCVRTLAEVRQKKPAFILMHAVRGMLPKNKLADQMLKKLKVYAGENHPHAAQSPVLFEK
ncbi:MAG: 50S ribosomal protein L13 [Puniceicoccales bacterium]|jgi:large subunit ribosomal protein L13|nr:50S ribosomal protein L13 [Puniceicoccales bacterium]